jgi:hypothetical protein
MKMSTELQDCKGILKDECGICPKCKDHTPCGCEYNGMEKLNKDIKAKIRYRDLIKKIKGLEEDREKLLKELSQSLDKIIELADRIK